MNTKMKRAVLLLAAAALLAQPLLAADNSARRRAASPPTEKTPATMKYQSNMVEAYLSTDTLDFIRPGLKVKVNSITIGSNRIPVVDVSITDDLDQPLDRLGKTTPGAVSLSFILAWYDPNTRQYTSYTTRAVTNPANSPRPGATGIQAGADSGGAFTDFESGHAKYTFKTVLPASFDATKTHTLGIYGSRNLTTVPGIPDALNKSYFVNVEFDFRPDGVTVTDKWDKMRDASTCLNCHDTQSQLNAHGGSRREIKLCALCHQPQTADIDTGNTVDMKVMAHKIHRGEHLPSVKAGTPYVIWGNGQSIHDFSNVAWPQILQTTDVVNCAACHEGSNPANKGAQSDAWYTKPGRDACGSCHDDINWATGANHAAGAQLDDKACANCHVPDSGMEFDASIKGAHTIPEKSKQLKGLTATIVSVTDMTPGKKPTAVFKIVNGDGTAVDGTKLGAFAPMFAGPTSSYSKYIRESGLTKGVFNATAGTTSYTFTAALPADAVGTWTMSADIYRNATLKRADGKADITLREAATNPIKYVALTGTVAARRTVVAMAQCNQCHDDLAMHGGQRKNIEECVTCHNPTEGDQARRPANAGQPESVSFQRLIHRIHTGENLTQDFTVYAFGGVATNFNEVRFPGDTRNCAKCHAGSSYTLPLATGIASVQTLRDNFTPQGPATAACLGCHDNKDAAAHAFLNTANFPGATIPAEACATCHGTGKDWAVEKVHAR
jgi:OmcA/MtrC family decaheme c-type cytochrome